MSGCDNITDEGIRALATGCPQLQFLGMFNCHKITDAGREIAMRIRKRKQFCQ
jgi:hypothetical protein